MENSTQNLELILKYFTDFTPRQLEQFAALNELYKEWNLKINIISRKDIDSLYEKHVLHSLSIARITEFKDGSEIIDIGTGGGFPGIPLAIVFPDAQFHLADSIAKKLKVVKEIAAATGLANVTTQHTRVEEIKNRKFDYAVSRAVAPLKDLWNWSRPLLRNKHGLQTGVTSSHFPGKVIPRGLICLKGGDLAGEIAQSGVSPSVFDIHKIFPEPFFREKFLLHIGLERVKSER